MFSKPPLDLSMSRSSQIFVQTTNETNSFWLISLINVLQLTVKLLLKEWQFSDGSKAVANYNPALVIHDQQNAVGTQPVQPTFTGRKLKISAIEGRNLAPMDRTGKSDPYLKLFYGKVRAFCWVWSCQVF